MEERIAKIEAALADLTERLADCEYSKASQSHCERMETGIERLRERVNECERKLDDKADHYDLRDLERKIENAKRGW